MIDRIRNMASWPFLAIGCLIATDRYLERLLGNHPYCCLSYATEGLHSNECPSRQMSVNEGKE